MDPMGDETLLEAHRFFPIFVGDEFEYPPRWGLAGIEGGIQTSAPGGIPAEVLGSLVEVCFLGPMQHKPSVKTRNV